MNKTSFYSLFAFFLTALCLLGGSVAMAGSQHGSTYIIKELLFEDGGGGNIDLSIEFELGSDRLTRNAASQLDELAQAFNSDALHRTNFEIAGHTDSRGSASSNKQLSRRRANSVKRYLVERHGVQSSRLQTIGWGEEQLKDRRNPESGVNRRVAIRNLTAPGGRIIGVDRHEKEEASGGKGNLW